MCDWREKIKESIPQAQEALTKWEEAATLYELVMTTWTLTRLLGVHLVLLRIRQLPHTHPGLCPQCSARLESKGKKNRKMLTLLGMIRFQRKVYRCPNRCHIGQICPLDQQLQLTAKEETCRSVRSLACLLAVCLPYQLASMLLGLLTQVKVSPKTIWNWVQQAGQHAMQRLDAELEQFTQEEASKQPLDEKLKPHLLAVGADGVMVPTRPSGGSPKGKTVWREVKVGVVVWLRKHTVKVGHQVLRPIQREVVAFLGELDCFKPRLWLAALHQGILTAKRAVWLSDGARGFWGVFSDYFAPYVTGILDFYHAAQYLWKGLKEGLDGRTKKAQEKFEQTRRQLRDGKAQEVLDEVQRIIGLEGLPSSARETLEGLHKYLSNHLEHIDYEKFKALGFPLGSGLVESTCKWLIQQRFKGVGMRWSEDGFNQLLHLRLAWVNNTYFELFEPKERV